MGVMYCNKFSCCGFMGAELTYRSISGFDKAWSFSAGSALEVVGPLILCACGILKVLAGLARNLPRRKYHIRPVHRIHCVAPNEQHVYKLNIIKGNVFEDSGFNRVLSVLGNAAQLMHSVVHHQSMSALISIDNHDNRHPYEWQSNSRDNLTFARTFPEQAPRCSS